jgi:hypothetical protein
MRQEVIVAQILADDLPGGPSQSTDTSPVGPQPIHIQGGAEKRENLK